jgi:TolB protein
MRFERAGRCAATACLTGVLLTGCGSDAGSGQASGEHPEEIAFVSDRDGNLDVFLLDVATAQVRNLTAHDGLDFGFSWSPDGTRLAFMSNRDGNDEIYVTDVDGEGLTRLTENAVRDVAPSWSPDGTRIAFVSRRDSESGEIYVMGADGSNVQRLTRNDRYEEVPSWSPDGTRIAFGALAAAEPDADPTLQVFVLDLATGVERQITFLGGHNSAPRWSPDGGRIAFYGQVGEGFTRADIMTVAPDGTDLRNLTNDDEPDWQPDWSDDGTRIVFARGPGDPLDLWVMNADGTERRQVTTTVGREEQPEWRPRAP